MGRGGLCGILFLLALMRCSLFAAFPACCVAALLSFASHRDRRGLLALEAYAV